jgi:G3E family GTPase
MQVIIFGGFVGSGKTSLILSLAHFLTRRRKPERPSLVIIENEIGEIGIDQKVLASRGLVVKELFSGCICCQLTADLITTLRDVADKIDPAWVIVEATGLAYPGKISDSLKKYGRGIERIRTVTVVDAERWEELVTVSPILVETQVAEGNVILINKTDLVDEAALQSVEDDVTRLNSRAFVYKVSAFGTIDDGLWEKMDGRDD